jgi:hypothetical protein
VVEPAPEFRGTTVQVCGLWPFSAGSNTPLIGAPLGRHWNTLATVCCDPISWFIHGLIHNPSMFVLGRPGLGKSSLIRRIVTVLSAWGYIPMVLSDLKPDYVALVRELGGQVISVGRGRESVNPLDPGPLWPLLHELPDELRGKALADLRSRRLNTLIGLLQLVRGKTVRITETEENVLGMALTVLDRTQKTAPVVDDVLKLVQDRHPELRRVALDRHDDKRYDDLTEALQASLLALTASGRFGDTFARPTSTPLELDKPVVFDLSHVDDSDESLQAAAQLVCWSYGSAAVACAQLLAEAGLRRQQHFLLVMDELWRMLRASSYMVDRIDAITRLNRQRGLGQIMCTHTMDDLKLDNAADTAKAWGFVSRSEIVALGGLAPSELGNLEQVFGLTNAEKGLITGWADLTGYSSGEAGERSEPPGRGAFLIKRGKAPGIPLKVHLVAAELSVNDTNTAWSESMGSQRR